MYRCHRCDYSTPHRHVLKAHLSKKKSCEDKNDNRIVVNDDLSVATSTEEESSPLQNQQRYVGGRKMNKRTKQDGTAFECACGRCFNQKHNLYRHRKTCLQVTNSATSVTQDYMRNLESKVTQLQERVQALSNTPSSSTTNTSNNVTINNIQVNAFGREDMSGVSEQVLDACLRRTDAGLADLIKNIHFDNACNRNVRARIENKEYIECHDGTDWNYKRKDPVLKNIVDNGHRIMSEHFDDHTDRLKKNMSHALFDYVCDWLRKMEKSNYRMYTEVMETVFLLIINQSSKCIFP